MRSRSLQIAIFFILIALFLQTIKAQQEVNSLSFDGVNDYVSMGYNSLLQPTTAVAVEAWVNCTNWGAAGNHAIVSTFATQGYILRLESGVLYARVYRNGAIVSASANVSAYTGWHHVAFTYNGRVIRLVIDGMQANAITPGGNFPVTYNANTTTTIGALSSGSTEFFNGTIDEVRIWSINRTAANFQTNMYTEFAPNTGNLRANYRFNQGSAGGANTGMTSLPDNTANAINGTLYNFSLSGSTSNWVNGVALKPFDQSSNVTFTNDQSTQMTINWQRPGTNKGGNGVKVFLRQTTTGSASITDGTNYTANSAFGSGAQAGTGWYCVYDGNNTSVNVTNLTANTAYRAQVVEYENVAGQTIRYSAATGTNNPANHTTTANAPATQASNITFANVATQSFTTSWTRGNGSGCIVFVSAGSTGTPAPANGTTYTANAAFGSGTQIGTSGWYCVYKGTGTAVSLTGLTPTQSYRVMAMEFNGVAGAESYLTTTNGTNPANKATIDFVAPTTQATTIAFSAITATGFTSSWTRGNGSNCAVFIKQTNSGTAAPANNTTYTANTVFGTGTQISSTGWYCVYKGTGTSVSITGLTNLQTYTVMVVEYNGITNFEKYNINSATNNPRSQATPDFSAPTTQATNITYSAITINSMTASWTRGNGSYCAAFIYLGSSGNAAPVNLTTYTANSAYGSGTQIGTSGWYCIYSGTGSSVAISGLSAVQTYRVMVCEYNGLPAQERYNVNTAKNNPNNRITGDYIAPTTQASNVLFNTVTGSSFTTTWTRGNGDNCAVFVKQTTTGNAAPVANSSYTANSTFGIGTQAGTGWYCVYNGTGTSVTVTGLTSSTTYRVMVCEYNGVVGLQKYNTTAVATNPMNRTTNLNPPTTQASNVSFSVISSTSLTAAWTIGNGSSRIVFINQTSSGTASPAADITYTANPAYGSGAQIGTSGWYCVYNGTGTSINITNLAPSTTYRVMVCEYSGTAGTEQYNTNAATNNPNNVTTDFAAPTIQASNLLVGNILMTSLNLSWTRGNGNNCIVFAALTSTGSPIPINNTSYTANTVFTSGTQIGTTGWYCVYKGVSTNVTITGLSVSSSYRFMVCEYNGTTGTEKYFTSTATNNPINATTASSTVWNGSSWSDGAPSASINATIDGNYNLSSTLSCNSLLVNNGYTLTIATTGALTVNGNITNNGNIIIKSPLNNGATGSLINQGNITNNGIMTAERYITPGTLQATNFVWHFMSLPVGQTIIDNVFKGDYAQKFIESTNEWKPYTTGEILYPMQGQMVKTINAGGKTIIYSGTFNTGMMSTSLVNTGGTADNGSNFVGNPYPSAIDWNAATGWTKTNVGSTIWIWNPAADDYAVWDGAVGTNGGSRYIAPMQGFFVSVDEGSTTGLLQMTNQVRVHNNISHFKSAMIPEIVRIKVSNDQFSDEAVIHRTEALNSSKKRFSLNPNVPQVYLAYSDKNFSILKVNPAMSDTTLEVGFQTEQPGEYQIRLSEITFNDAYDIYLTDYKLNTTTLMSAGSVYTFNHEANDAAVRFSLSLKKKESIITIIKNSGEQNINIWASRNKVYVDNQLGEKINIEIYNLQGIKIAMQMIVNTGIEQILIQKPGVYIVVAQSKNGKKTKKIIIE
jgi:hypothetical protein